jgi:tetratricopeptide (TPR) repeat protein
MASLGALNTSKNLLHDAEALLRKALSIQEEKLGDGDRELAPTLGLIALCRMRRRDYSTAESLAKRALEIRSAAYGVDHPNTAMTLHILASTCMAQGKFEQAAIYYERALSIRERFLTINHSGIVSVLRVLGYTYIQLRDYSKAEAIFQRLESLAVGQPSYTREWCDAVRYQAQMYVMSRQFEEGEHYIYRALDQFDQANIDNEECKSRLIKSLVRCHLGQKKFVDAAREVPAIASMTVAQALKKLEGTQSVSTIREMVGAIKRRSSPVESDN